MKITEKLHRQFSHPSGFKLASLARNAGIRDREFLKILEEFPSACDICLTYKKAEQRPIVRFSLATQFNEQVAMVVKDLQGHKVCHIIDHGTRYNVAAEIPNKESFSINECIFKYCISYFGTPDFFLSDNGREFDNQEFQDMTQNLNVVVRTTAA